jgi:DNA invertase Pin-like site-specific DNA recombinase
MANALVVQGTKAVIAQIETRAAQYVRMSTDYQRYSIENQAVVIAAYAQLHGLEIVRTYRDAGESGLKLKNRAGLIQLLDDVQSGRADFRHILVYDVSRWGRFQDTDESAHYEYLCKKAGMKVAYCAEQFDNDCTMMSSILKNIKRVMAAEYSRELSVKIFAGASRFARMGFRTSGEVGYGLRRQLVDEKLRPKAIMERGERKYLMTDHVRVSPGPAEEVAVVRWIFEQFLKNKYQTLIALELNQRGVPTNTGGPWNASAIGRILRNESYIGNLIYNRSSIKLRERRKLNPPNLWIRSEGCIDPIIESDVFLRAQKIIDERRVDLSTEEMLKRLRLTLKKRGKLTPTIISQTPGLPSVHTFMKQFGSLREAYRLIGYTSSRDCGFIESKKGWADLNAKLVAEVAAEIERAGAYAEVTKGNSLCVNGRVAVSFRVARWVPRRRKHHAQYWSFTRIPSATGWILALRLGERNQFLLDYLLLPAANVEARTLRFAETTRKKYGIECFETFPTLVLSLVRRIGNANSTARKVVPAAASRKRGKSSRSN